MGRKVSDGKSIKVTVPENTTIEQGKFYLLDGFLGMAVQAVITGVGETAQVVLNIENGEYETSQVAADDTLAAGTKVYWDNTNKVFTQAAAGNRFAGVVTVGKDANNVMWFWFAPQQTVLVQAATVAAVASADAAETYTAAEQALINELKSKLNTMLNNLKTAGIIAS